MAKPRRKGTRIRSGPALPRLLAEVEINPVSGCWDWRGAKYVKGYGNIRINGVRHLAHRLSFELHRGSIPAGLCVCHTCDNRACVNPAHLFIGTNSDNVADKVAKGRQSRLPGMRNGRAKLTEQEVVDIRASVGVTATSLARRYGVSIALISEILLGKSWAHLGSEKNG